MKDIAELDHHPVGFKLHIRHYRLTGADRKVSVMR